MDGFHAVGGSGGIPASFVRRDGHVFQSRPVCHIRGRGAGRLRSLVVQAWRGLCRAWPVEPGGGLERGGSGGFLLSRTGRHVEPRGLGGCGGGCGLPAVEGTSADGALGDGRGGVCRRVGLLPETRVGRRASADDDGGRTGLGRGMALRARAWRLCAGLRCSAGGFLRRASRFAAVGGGR